jgi:hypothetical protein
MPSAPPDTNHGCLGWKATEFTAALPTAPCPRSTFRGTSMGLRVKSLQTEHTSRKTDKINRTVQANTTIVSEKTEKMTLSQTESGGEGIAITVTLPVDHAVEDVHAAVVRGRGHQRIAPIRTAQQKKPFYQLPRQQNIHQTKSVVNTHLWY